MRITSKTRIQCFRVCHSLESYTMCHYKILGRLKVPLGFVPCYDRRRQGRTLSGRSVFCCEVHSTGSFPQTDQLGRVVRIRRRVTGIGDVFGFLRDREQESSGFADMHIDVACTDSLGMGVMRVLHVHPWIRTTGGGIARGRFNWWAWKS